MSNFRTIIALSAAILAATATQAQSADGHTLGQHPALLVKARAQTIDANLFIVQPPASVSWVKPHSNGEHPAMLVARHAATIDGNTFQVQPPASVTWTLGPAAETASTLVARVGR